jgi:hypothetical protein
MLLSTVLALTEAEPISPDLDPEMEVCTGAAADLMSDCLRYDLACALLVSGLANPQVVRTSEMADVAAILMVRGKVPPSETMVLAQEVGIPIMGTHLNMFEACGRLYAAGLPACKRRNGHD